ncbi:uncharacterized protein LOC110833760 [Zootermopsis nevadensis]|uniref:uncharacterized protein LOC110833760 n=1 Tax=Zootermopsis nevadensis TaxID=136037 RepID=UPI000B8EAB08|nr:uncharacterized protein LOC110833760 [Zootermopsis nevadensis]
MDAGERCSNLNTSGVSFIQKCRDDRRTCMVKRYSYSTSTENSSYPSKHLWSLQRNCINKCEPGCIVIGERTKLYACTACCEKSLCNTMNDAASNHQHSTFFAVLGVVLLTAFTS